MGRTIQKKLLVVSHVIHYQYQGKLYAYGPYVREIDIWADLFPSVVIASPCKNVEPPGDCLSFTRQNIAISAIDVKDGGRSLKDRIQLIFSFPKVIFQLSREMHKAWAIHVRLPGNLGAIGSVIAPIFSTRIIAKYAGTWPDFEGEPRSYRKQKRVLKSKWFRGPVTVYGDWPNQPRNIIPFFTSILTSEQIKKASQASKNKAIHSPVRILFVGRFDKGKNAHILLDALFELRQLNIQFESRIIGDGIERENLHKQCKELGLDQAVEFTGAIPYQDVLTNLVWGDILVLTSENAEGWPKAIAEGMAFGLVCFGSKRGLIPQMLSNGQGIVIDPITPKNLANEIINLIESPEKYQEISKRAALWSQGYTLEKLQQNLRDLMIQKWNLQDSDLRDIYKS